MVDTLSHTRLAELLKANCRLIVSYSGKTGKWCAVISDNNAPVWSVVEDELDILLSKLSTRIIPAGPVLAPGDKC